MILCLYPIFETFDGALSRWLRRAIRELYTALCVSIIHYNIWFYYGLKIKLNCSLYAAFCWSNFCRSFYSQKLPSVPCWTAQLSASYLD